MTAAVAIGVQQPAVLAIWLGNRPHGSIRSTCTYVCAIASDGMPGEVQMLLTDDEHMHQTRETIKAMRDSVEAANGIPKESRTYCDELHRNWKGRKGV